MAVPNPFDALTRPSGAFAMLAIDQRESMRAMFGEYHKTPVTDQQLTDFKLAVLQALTPFASAVLIDRQFAWRQAIDQKAVAADCGLIAAADHFIPSAEELVSDVRIDDEVKPQAVKSDGAAALKLLVLWRPDESAEFRKNMVRDFIGRCREADLLSIIEPVSRKPRDGRAWDLNDGIQAAAEELGNLGADLYKAEVPLHGKGGERAVREASARLNKTIQGPWVVLSSGVSPDDFPQAVEWACREGASGFLAGRAVWRNVIGNPDIHRALIDDAAVRLKRLCDVVDSVVVRR
jgi:sulfofructosephosphate aldolase